MCTGLEVAALAAMVGGSYMQYQSNEKKAEAMDDAAMAEAMRQDKLDREKELNFSEALQGFDRKSQDANIEDAAADRLAALNANVGLPGEDLAYQSPAAEGQPKVVKEYGEQKQEEADNFVSLLGDARARLGAFSEGMIPFADKLGDLSWENSELNHRAGRSAQIGAQDVQLSGANTGNGLALAGNLLSSAGSMGMNYAGQQGSFANLLGKGSGSTAGAAGANAVGNTGLSWTSSTPWKAPSFY